jgi:hypothetical protein
MRLSKTALRTTSPIWRRHAPGATPVRTMQEQDVPAIAGLYKQVYGNRRGPDREELEGRLLTLFFRNPWYDAGYPSLVHEDESGGIIGCVGVLPRPMLFGSCRVIVAVSHSFMVAPGRRGSMAALELTRQFFAGDQDLSLAEGNNHSQKIWNFCGGITDLPRSFCWTRPLRPAQYGLSFLVNRGMPGVLARLLRPMTRLADAIAPAVRKTFDVRDPGLTAEELADDFLASLLPEASNRFRLRPFYSGSSSVWLMQTLGASLAPRSLSKTLLHNRSGRTVGWYVYHLKASGIAEVLHMAAHPGMAGRVLDHLFYYARQRGAIAVTGQFDPLLTGELAERACMFHHGGTGSWLLLHSNKPEIITAIRDDDVFMSRLESEWWIALLLG